MIAALRYEIDLLARNEASDGAGGASIAWTVARTLWAAVEDLPAIGAIIGDKGVRIRRIKALVRARADFTLGARVRFDGDDFEIVSIESDDERGRRIFLIGEEVVE